jgi:hypothetical protein
LDLLVWFSEQQSLLGLILMDRELSEKALKYFAIQARRQEMSDVGFVWSDPQSLVGQCLDLAGENPASQGWPAVGPDT